MVFGDPKPHDIDVNRIISISGDTTAQREILRNKSYGNIWWRRLVNWFAGEKMSINYLFFYV